MPRISRWSIVPVAAALLTLIGVVAPQRAGPVAVLAVVGPFLYALIVVLLVPLAVLRRDAALAAMVAGGALVAALAYGGPPAPAIAAQGQVVTVLSWNLHGEPLGRSGLAAVLERWQPDLVILQEAAIDGDADRRLFPDGMQVMAHPRAATPPGMVLASALPILASGEVAEPPEAWDRPRAFWLRLAAPGGALTLAGLHLSVPFPVSSLPCPYCPTLRDAQVRALAQFAADRSAAGERVLLAGDFNLVEREVAYRELAGLTDAARGATWRPVPASWMPPWLRLDYVFVGTRLGAGGSTTDCGVSHSDHCPLIVDVRLLQGAQPSG